MQVAFQNENVLEKNTSSTPRVAQNFGLGEAGLNFRNSQANFKTHKSENETYGTVSYTHLTLPTILLV